MELENVATPNPAGEVTPPVTPPEDVKETPETPAEDTTAKEADGSPPEKEKGAAEPSKTVPYERFKEVYAEKKSMERMLEAVLESRKTPVSPPVSPEIPETLPETMLPPEPMAPEYDSFETEADYRKAMAQYHKELGRWGAKVELMQTQHAEKVKAQKAAGEQKRQQFMDFREKANQKYEDFEMTVGSIPLNQPTLDALMESDLGMDVAYFLGQNPQEAKRIYALPEKAMLKELGKLEVKLSEPPPKPKKQTDAPAPITPVVGEGTIVTKNLEDMTPEEYYKYRTEQIRKGKG